MGSNSTLSTNADASMRTQQLLYQFEDNTAVSNISIFTQNDRIFAIVLIPLNTIIIVGNILALISAVARARSSNHVGYFFIANLAIADLLLGLASTGSIIIVFMDNWREDVATCILRIGLVVMSCAASIYTIACIAIDRCIAVNAALRYKELVTPARALLAIASTWAFAITYGFFPLMSQPHGYCNKCSILIVLSKEYILVLFFVGFLPTVILILFVYTSLYLVTKHQLRSINALDQFRRGRRQSTLDKLRYRRTKRNLKAAKLLALVIGTFCVCWFPFVVTSLVQVFCGEECQLQDIAGTYLVLLGFLNSALNPAIYASYTKDSRKSGRSFFCKKRVEPFEP